MMRFCSGLAKGARAEALALAMQLTHNPYYVKYITAQKRCPRHIEPITHGAIKFAVLHW
ncbi:hypothetical protein TRP8649_02558 [Pelagimonas phthalicica]|uniref:Uncharacterized protein n=1 Tax=Pelagimonas phthalicica TaxID=1037362 RepID=A0A238JCN6_9RHOB|nr:hypothetical protein CLV87_2559 [Pelagimonas phthalicica]SMX28438.1 hypothetical protein TRP8649_02558 [Pelagimonas phthalicica]